MYRAPALLRGELHLFDPGRLPHESGVGRVAWRAANRSSSASAGLNRQASVGRSMRKALTISCARGPKYMIRLRSRCAFLWSSGE